MIYERYVYPSELTTFGSISARQRMITTGSIGRSWANNYTTAARLSLHCPSIGSANTPYPPYGLDLHSQKDSHTLDTAAFLPHSEGDLSYAALSFVHGGPSPHIQIYLHSPPG
jgi:hypothetical protein